MAGYGHVGRYIDKALFVFNAHAGRRLAGGIKK